MITHAELVKNLVKPGSVIASSITSNEANLWHLATGVSGEAGELLDAIKKHVIYKKPLDRDNVIEELGDLFFYIEGLCQALNVSREEVLQKNIDKLSIRYKDGYTDKAAQDRADKQ